MGLEALAVPFLIIGGLADIIGGLSQAQQQKQAAELSAEMAREDAATVREWSRIHAEEFREAGERLKGTQRAVVGGSAAKLTKGSPLYIMQETKAKLEEDAMRIRKEGERVARRYEKEAGYYQRVAGQIVPASLLGIGATLFSRLAGYGFSKWSPTTTTKPITYGPEPYRFSPYGY